MKIKDLFDKIRCNKRLLYSLDAGLFFSSILIMLLSQAGDQEAESRAVIGGGMFYVSFVLFPLISMEKKGEILEFFGKHIFLFFISLLSLYHSLLFYDNHWNGGAFGCELLAAIELLIFMSWTVYIFVGFVKACIYVISKLKSHIFSESAKENYSSAKKIIEGITAFILALSAMALSISTLIATMKSFIN
ncbi:MAG: hypothetical protein IJM38_08965 [Ruminococcus sp.]|nr:hypothetical protein [Ruminococcus sp.]